MNVRDVFVETKVKGEIYGKEIEEGIVQLIKDISTKKIEIRAHNSKKLHSKFYIFLSPNFMPNVSCPGYNLVSSSNINNFSFMLFSNTA